MLKKRSFRLLIFIFITPLMVWALLFACKDHFRNKDAVAANIVNRIFNLNQVFIDFDKNENDTIKVIWSSDSHEKLVFSSIENSKVSKFPNEYGPNLLLVEVNSKKFEKAFVKPNWWNTFDITIEVHSDTVIFKGLPE